LSYSRAARYRNARRGCSLGRGRCLLEGAEILRAMSLFITSSPCQSTSSPCSVQIQFLFSPCIQSSFRPPSLFCMANGRSTECRSDVGRRWNTGDGGNEDPGCRSDVGRHTIHSLSSSTTSPCKSPSTIRLPLSVIRHNCQILCCFTFSVLCKDRGRIEADKLCTLRRSE
jgi:hypothetical protein